MSDQHCPACSNKPESYFAIGNKCAVCGRRESFLLRDIAQLNEKTPPEHDRNKDGAIEFIDAVVRNEPIWPNPWGQDVAFVAFVIHSDRQRIAELEALRTEHHQQYTENFAKLEAANDKMRKCLEAIESIMNEAGKC